MANKSKTTIPIDDSCFELLSRTAKKTHITVSALASICVESFIGSLANYGVTAPSTDIKAIVGSTKGKTIQLPKRTYDELNKVGVYLGASMSTMVRDAILGQRFNFQRMQPVNARSMPSVRMTLFRMEQGGGQAQAS
tara:strand:- start:813 stop:1223 length:411 start_codon:yes stop_codon:yes gene_type:complete